MMKSLQRRFVLIVMLALLVVFVVLLVGINLTNFLKVDSRLEGRLNFIFDNDGTLPVWHPQSDSDQITEETPYETRYFVIRSGQSYEEQEINLDNIASVSKEDAGKYLREVLECGKTYGYKDDYKYYVADTSFENYMVIFLYCLNEIQAVKSMIHITAIVGIISYALVFLLVVLASRSAIKPYIANIERQKQFITDASHEIKTPLGIISANNDVLTIQYGDNEWLESSRHQAVRLTGLVNSLISLARLDEAQPTQQREEFCISDTILDVAADFGSVAKLEGKQIDTRLDQGVSYFGDESALRQLLSILLDNAVRYSSADSGIKINMYTRKKACTVSVENQCDMLDTNGLDRLFDRFYRQDASRSDKSGYGLGLSIAKGIADAHRWMLRVSSSDGTSIKFEIEL